MLCFKSANCFHFLTRDFAWIIIMRFHDNVFRRIIFAKWKPGVCRIIDRLQKYEANKV